LAIGSLASRAAFRAIKAGYRLPRFYALNEFRQHTRTIDELRKHQINLVFDVGANRGFYSQHLRASGYEGYIVAFEPVSDCFDELNWRMRGDPRFKAFNCALGDQIGSIVFNEIRVGNNEAVLSSFLSHRGDLPTKQSVVPVRTVRDILETEAPVADPRVFLKMDTQGYDLKVFAGCENANEIKLLLSEVSVFPLYHEMPPYTEALATYEQAGFELLDMFVVGETDRGNIGEFDVLMGRVASMEAIDC